MVVQEATLALIKYGGGGTTYRRRSGTVLPKVVFGLTIEVVGLSDQAADPHIYG